MPQIVNWTEVVRYEAVLPEGVTVEDSEDLEILVQDDLLDPESHFLCVESRDLEQIEHAGTSRAD